MQKEEHESTLYIPVNIKTRFEFFDGFGFAELTITAITGALSIFIAMIIYAFTDDFYKGVLIVLITLATTGMAVRKNEINQSVTDMISLYFRFANTQQKYPYEYKSNYPLRLEKEDLWK